MYKIKLITLCYLLAFYGSFAQGNAADYQRARDIANKISNKVWDVPMEVQWDEAGTLFWYEKNTAAGRVFVLVNPAKPSKEALFDKTLLERQLAEEVGKTVSFESVPRRSIKLAGDSVFDFEYERWVWSWDRRKNQLHKKDSVIRQDSGGGYWGRRFDDSKGKPVASPNGSTIAYLKNNNIYIAEKENPQTERQLTYDGSPGEYYAADIQWSPDGKKVAGMKVRKAEVRQLTLLESSPLDQLQPKLQTRDYPKPGDALPQYYPVIYNLESNKLYKVDPAMVDNQFSLSRLGWRQDSRSVTFEFNKRGHQQYAIVALSALDGATRYIVNETSKTFIDYSGKRYRYDVNDGSQLIWASERDGWNHLYLYDGNRGQVLNQITKGEWVVRKVVHVDEGRREIIFEGSGKHQGQDPYFIHYYIVDFDGKNLRTLTKENASHRAYFNRDHHYFVDVYSRVDQAPISVLRDRKGRVVMELEHASEEALKKEGWRAPEVFTAKGRDGVHDIWGIIVRPTNFDPTKKYPVIEYIYAGPHSSFVPKTFTPNPSGMQELAELGFIVLQIDGMGTSNRSKAFHDVCWKNLKDAGFPDRIIWMKEAAKKYPYMDLDRVGIYGTSAGGQSSTAALLFHPEFYKVAVSSCGCHDNRMDKIWWNEQWMGWPVGPEYAASSNVEHAAKLEGKLMLIVGELDDNVDPASTYQLVHALIKAEKDHELIVVPGMGHSSGGTYGEKKRRDFFVKHLMGVDPPAWSLHK